MAFVNTLFLFFFFWKSEQGLLSIGQQIVRNVFHAQTHLFFPMNNFPLYLFWHLSLPNFPHHHLILFPETCSQVPGDVINTRYGGCPTLDYAQNCWAVMCYRLLIFLMLLGIIPALTIYKIPIATQYIEMRLHFTACQNNRPSWDHFSFFGFRENTILRSAISCQLQAIVVVVFS